MQMCFKRISRITRIAAAYTLNPEGLPFIKAHDAQSYSGQAPACVACSLPLCAVEEFPREKQCTKWIFAFGPIPSFLPEHRLIGHPRLFTHKPHAASRLALTGRLANGIGISVQYHEDLDMSEQVFTSLAVAGYYITLI